MPMVRKDGPFNKLDIHPGGTSLCLCVVWCRKIYFKWILDINTKKDKMPG